MRIVLRKLFWAWDFDKEEAWLNQKSAQGLALIAVGFCRYEFEEAAPGAYQIRLDLLPHGPNHPESQKYLQFLEESGIRQVGSLRRWVYLRRSTQDGAFHLHSDRDAQFKMLGRLMVLLGAVAFPNLYCVIWNLYVYWRYQAIVSLFGALVCTTFLFLLTWGWWVLYRKSKTLQREQNIFE